MHEIVTQYQHFVRNMWLANCRERESFREPTLTREQYEKQKTGWLEDQFYSTLVANWVWDEKIADYRAAWKHNFCMPTS